jgi:hypothetical protein
MKKSFTLKSIVIVAVFSLMAFIGFNSFTNKNKTDNTAKRAVEWYTVSQITPGTDWSASNLEITSGVISEPTGDECNIDNDGNPCSARFNNNSGSPLPVNTVLDALPSGAAFQIYAKQPE